MIQTKEFSVRINMEHVLVATNASIVDVYSKEAQIGPNMRNFVL